MTHTPIAAMRLLRRPHCVVAAFVALSACSKPKPVELEPRSAQVSAIRADSVQLSLVLGVRNPNSFPIIARSVSGVFELQDGTELGRGGSTSAFTVPAEGAGDFKALLDVPFSNLSALAPYALAGKPVPYRIRGTARLGGEHLNLEVPFAVSGQLSAEQAMVAGMRGAANSLAPPAQ